MTDEPLIEDFMTLQPQAIEAHESIDTAKAMMTRFGIRHLPVTSDGVVVGMLSERDINLALGIETEGVGELPVADVCSERPYTVHPETPLREVVAVMARKHFGSAIVMENAKLVGIFTTVDACRALSELIETAVQCKNLERIRTLRK